MVDWVEMEGGVVSNFSRIRTDESRAGHGPLNRTVEGQAAQMKAATLKL